MEKVYILSVVKLKGIYVEKREMGRDNHIISSKNVVDVVGSVQTQGHVELCLLASFLFSLF